MRSINKSILIFIIFCSSIASILLHFRPNLNQKSVISGCEQEYGELLTAAQNIQRDPKNLKRAREFVQRCPRVPRYMKLLGFLEFANDEIDSGRQTLSQAVELAKELGNVEESLHIATDAKLLEAKFNSLSKSSKAP